MAQDTPRAHSPRWRHEAPAWGISAVLHVLLLIALAAMTWHTREPVERQILIDLRDEAAEEGQASVDGEAEQAAGALGQATDSTDRRQGQATIPEPPPSDASADAAATLSQPTPPSSREGPSRSSDPALALLQQDDQGDGEAGGRAAAGAGLLDGSSDAFQRLLGRMQRRGLDVVFVLDATGNMGPFIAQTQQRIERVADVLGGMIEPPDDDAPGRGIRFGMVAFKDYGDEYGINASIHLPLTDDRAQLRNFIDQVIVGGGGDQTEPIHEALAVAADRRRMGYRRNSESVIVLVTEAAVHLTGRDAAMETARRFHRSNGQIHVIDVGAVASDGRERVNVLQDLQNIAEHGGGQAFLLQEEQAFWRQLIVSIFGQRYEQDVEAILRRYREAQPPEQ